MRHYKVSDKIQDFNSAVVNKTCVVAIDEDKYEVLAIYCKDNGTAIKAVEFLNSVDIECHTAADPNRIRGRDSKPQNTTN